MNRCLYCNKELVHKKNKFCSHICYGKYKKGKQPKGGFKKGKDIRREKTTFKQNHKWSKNILDKISKTLTGKYRAEKSCHWKGGRVVDKDGYIYIYSKNHPNANSKHYVFEHRLIMEKHMGRTLLPTEIVHHINMNKSDNRIENLMLFSSNKEHLDYHRKNLNMKTNRWLK